MTAHPAQAELFRPCAWCGLPGMHEIEVEPAVIRTDKKSGEAAIIKAPIVVYACDEHAHVAERDDPDVASVRRRKARGVDQLSFLDAPASGPSSAIFGDQR